MKITMAMLCFCCCGMLSGDEGEKSWSQWRGNKRDSIVRGPWPKDLTAGNLRKVWSKPFGPSYSGPIVFGDTVFTTESNEQKEEVAFALERSTGKEKWSVSWKGSMKVPFFAAKNGNWIRSTPATDGKRLYVAGMRGRLVCIDIAAGQELWSVDFSERYSVTPETFGHVCSPLIIDADESKDRYLYIQCNAGFLKLDRLTGEEVWRTLDNGDSAMTGGAFSSPYVAEVAGKRQILVQTRTDLAGVDIESGNVLWKQPVPNFRGMNILTPTVHGDTVFTSSYNHQSFGYNVSKQGAEFSVDTKWTAASKAYMSSPVVIDGHAYVHLQNRRIACINIESGQTTWKSSQRFGEYWSMVANGNQILALDSAGKLFLVNANPESFELAGEMKLETNDSWAHLAVVGNQVFVRGLKSLAVYQWGE